MPRAIGQPISRVEDPRLLRGEGRFVGDIRLPGTLEAVVVRSLQAHALVRAVRAGDALRLPGITAVVTTEDLAREGWLEAAQQAGARLALVGWPEVSYVGQPVAVIVAESRYVAEDAADLLEVNYEPLPVVASIETALAEDAPKVRTDLDSNLAVHKVVGYGDVDAAFRDAEIVLEEEFTIARAAAHPLETRGIVAAPDPATNGLTVWAGTQMPHIVRRSLSLFLGFPERAVRVIVPDVGGAFGSKSAGYPEEFLIPLLAYRLSRPVRWLEDRREHFVATLHEREQIHRIRLAARGDGRLLAVDDTFWMDMGAYASWPHLLDRTITTLPGPYGREIRDFGDLGPRLGEALRRRAHALGIELLEPREGIRATCIGASQYTVQLSGDTIFLSDPQILPLRSLPVVAARGIAAPSAEQVAAAVRQAMARLDLDADDGGAFTLAVRWPHGADYAALRELCAGIVEGLGEMPDGRPLLVVVDADVAGLVGTLLQREFGVTGDIVCIDQVHLREFEYIDIGRPLPAQGVVPVVVKSLVFR